MRRYKKIPAPDIFFEMVYLHAILDWTGTACPINSSISISYIERAERALEFQEINFQIFSVRH